MEKNGYFITQWNTSDYNGQTKETTTNCTKNWPSSKESDWCVYDGIEKDLFTINFIPKKSKIVTA